MDSSESSPDSARPDHKRIVDLDVQRLEHGEKIVNFQVLRQKDQKEADNDVFKRQKNERDKAAHQEAERLEIECLEAEHQQNKREEDQLEVKTKMDKLGELRESISQTRSGIRQLAGDLDMMKSDLFGMKGGVEKQEKLLDEVMNETSSSEGSAGGADVGEEMEQ